MEMWFLVYFTVFYQWMCLCNIGKMRWWLQLVNRKIVKGSGHGLFQGTIWLANMVHTLLHYFFNQSFFSFLLELSVCMVQFQHCWTYNNIFGIKLMYVLSGCFQPFKSLQECWIMFSTSSSGLISVDLIPRWHSKLHTPQEHCYKSGSPQTALEEIVNCASYSLHLQWLSPHCHHSCWHDWETTLHRAVLDCNRGYQPPRFCC
jgi:hypothetical protein